MTHDASIITYTRVRFVVRPSTLLNNLVILLIESKMFFPQLMSQGQIMHAASYQGLLLSSREFQNLVNAHKDIVNFPNDNMVDYNGDKSPFKRETAVVLDGGKESIKNAEFDQLIRREEREIGGTGLKPYLMYLGQNKGYIYATLVAIANIAFTSGQLAQNSWLAANIQNPGVSTFNLVQVYTAIGIGSIMFLLFRALLAVDLGLQTSRSLFSQLLTALFRAPMSFFHSTPIGRILSRVSTQKVMKLYLSHSNLIHGNSNVCGK